MTISARPLACVLLLLVLQPAEALVAQQLSSTSYLVEDGLPHSQVWSVMHDSRGYAWIGTSSGLSRYDGMSFLNFGAEQGLSNVTVRTIVEARDGSLWLGTDDGLARFDGRRIRSYAGVEGMPRGLVWSSTRDGSGRIWFGTQNHGAVLIDGEDAESFGKTDGLASDYVYAIHADHSNRLWMGHRGEGVTRCAIRGDRLTQCTTFSVRDGLPHGEVRAIAQDGDGNLWFGTRGGGVARYDGTRFEVFGEAEGIVQNDVYALLATRGGELVVGTLEKGLTICDLPALSVCRTFDMGNGLPDDDVLALHEDGEANLWIGFENGLTRLATTRAMSFSIRDGLPHHTVYAVEPSRDGEVFLGTLSGLAVARRGDRRTHWTIDPVIAPQIRGQQIWDLLRDRNGSLWVATNRGLCQYDGAGCRRWLTEADGLPSSELVTLGELRDGTIVVTTAKGPAFVRVAGDSVSVTPVVPLSGAVPAAGYAVGQDLPGRIWIGTDRGLDLIVGDRHVRRWTTADGLASNEVSAIWVAPDGEMYIGLYGAGVVRLDPRTVTDRGKPVFHPMGADTGIPASVAALAGSGMTLWIGTNEGLFAIDRRGEGRANVVIDKGSGLIGNEVNVLRWDGRDRLWIGVVGGATRFDPSSGLVVTGPPKVRIEEVSVVGGESLFQPFSLVSAGGSPVHWLDQGSVVFPHDKNSVRFEFRALSFRDRGQLRFQVRLVGFDDAWSDPTRESFKEYTNLDPGSYRFEVRAARGGGAWSAPVSQEFTIRHAWWQAPWFLLFAILGTTLLLVAIYRWRTYAMEQRTRKLEDAVAERTADLRRYARALEEHGFALDQANVRIRQADRVKSEFLANMSHELRTPLNSIIGFADVLQPRLAPRMEERELRFLHNIQSSGRYLLLLINNLLDLSKIEAGRMDLDLERVAVGGLIESTCGVVQGYAADRGVNLEVTIDDDPGEVVTDVAKLRQILLNLLSNAIKFSPEGGTVSVGASRSQGGWTLSVADQGPGIPPEDRAIIFDEFRQSRRSAHPGGTGLGLSIVRQFVQLMQGTIVVGEPDGGGSRFLVEFPLEITASSGDVESRSEAAVQQRVLLFARDSTAWSRLTTALEREGFLPVRVETTEEAARVVAEIEPAVVIADLAGEPDAPSALRALEPAGSAGGLGAVMLMQRETEVAIVTADGWFVEPIDVADLVSTVALSINSVSTQEPCIIFLGFDSRDVAGMEGLVDCAISAVRDIDGGIDAVLAQHPSAVVIRSGPGDVSPFEIARRIEASRGGRDTSIWLVLDREQAGIGVPAGGGWSADEVTLLVHELVGRRSSRVIRRSMIRSR